MGQDGRKRSDIQVQLVFIQLCVWVSGLGLELDKNIDGAFCELLTMIFCHNWTAVCPACPPLLCSFLPPWQCSI